MYKRKTCSSFYLLDFKGGPITKTGPKFKKPRFLSSLSNSLEQNPNHSNKTWSLSLSLSIGLGFFKNIVHCYSFAFADSIPAVHHAYCQHWKRSSLRGSWKNLQSALSLNFQSQIFLYLNSFIGEWSHCVGLYWIKLNSTRRVRRALLQFRDRTRWRRKRLHIFLFLAINFEMLDFSI